MWAPFLFWKMLSGEINAYIIAPWEQQLLTGEQMLRLLKVITWIWNILLYPGKIQFKKLAFNVIFLDWKYFNIFCLNFFLFEIIFRGIGSVLTEPIPLLLIIILMMTRTIKREIKWCQSIMNCCSENVHDSWAKWERVKAIVYWLWGLANFAFS